MFSVPTMLLAALAAMPASIGESDLGVAAELTATELVPGESYELVVTLEIEGEIHTDFPWESERAPDQLRRPLLQISAPDCVELLGGPPKDLIEPVDFQEQYQRKPWGRRFLEKTLTVPFRLIAEPGDEDHFGLNVIAYLGADTSDEARFFRQRLAVPVAAGATGTVADGNDTSWGPGDILAVGDAAPDFDLPQAAGANIKLSAYRGKTVLLVIYRRKT